jgi:hypothetical protein
MQRTLALIAIFMLFPLTACVATPRIQLAERISFNSPMPNQSPMSYNDLLCCYDCHA